MASEGLRARGGGAGGKASSELSVIVPAYNETENIRPLCERLFKATAVAGIVAELFIVDDESSGSAATEKIVKELQSEGHPVRIHCRKKSEGRGLSSAVLLGFEKAKFNTLLCMDADLQHEPESVPDVAKPVMRGEADFSVGSRHVEGGGLGFDWSLMRRVVSRGATLLALGLTPASDPMSGFFCVRQDVLERGRPTINPIGFKIGLEIMVRCECKKIQDVGITFQERAAGESKLSVKHYKLYIEQLVSLYWAKFGLMLLLVPLILFFLANQILGSMLGDQVGMYATMVIICAFLLVLFICS